MWTQADGNTDHERSSAALLETQAEYPATGSQYEINNTTPPFNFVVYIKSTFPNGLTYTGSGVIVGKNDVLTAGHMVYSSSDGGYATSVKVIPGYDSSPVEKPYGEFYASNIQSYTNFDPDGDGYLYRGDGATNTFAGSELDLAVLGFNSYLGRDIGMMWLDPYFTSGTENITGYPAYYGRNPMNSTGTATKDSVDTVIDTTNFEIHPGNSGGPVWHTDGNQSYVAGVVSTAAWAAAVAGHKGDLTNWLRTNDYLVDGDGYYLVGDAANNSLSGSSGGDQIDGGAGNDTISGGDGADILSGGAGDDTVDGGNGNDVVNGGIGNDVVSGGAGNNTINGGTGEDWLSYAAAIGAVTVNLSSGSSLNGYGGSDSLGALEDVLGSAFGDTIVGDSGNNRLSGGAGNDTLFGLGGNNVLDGGAGSDFVDYTNAPAGTTVNLTSGTGLNGYGGSDTYASIEHVMGSAYGDVILGDGINNAINGGGGNDTLRGQGGNDDLVGGAGNNMLDGGDGVDRVNYSPAPGAVTINLESGTGANGYGGSDNFGSIENVLGSTWNDLLFGSNTDNLLDGSAGNDTIHAQGGNDTLIGGAGNNLLDGGSGTDTADYSGASSAVTVNLSSGSGINGYGGNDNFGSIENLMGSNFDDLMVGDAQNNVLYGLSGNDIMYAGAGNNTYDGGTGSDRLLYLNAPSAVTINLTSGTGLNGYGGSDNFGNIEHVTGSAYNDLLVGDGVNNELHGGAGNDTLRGEGGNDNLIGGAGNNTLDGGAGVDRLDYSSAPGTATVNLTSGTSANGWGGADNFGNIEDILGSAFDDLFVNGTGINTLTGGAGNDTFQFVRGVSNGDMLTDFAGHEAAVGDYLIFSGYGTSGASFVQADATHWQINSSDGAVHELITFANAASINSSDWAFV